MLTHSIRSYMRIPQQMVRKNKRLLFQVDNHSIFISLHVDLEFQHEVLPFCITENGMKAKTIEWHEHLHMT